MPQPMPWVWYSPPRTAQRPLSSAVPAGQDWPHVLLAHCTVPPTYCAVHGVLHALQCALLLVVLVHTPLH